MARKSFGIALMALIARSALSADKPTEREHLPSGVTPLHYDLALVPDAVNLRFRGRVRITVEVKASTQVIVLNAAELSFDQVVLDQEETEASVKLDSKLQRAALTFLHPVATGRHTLTLDYHGAIGSGTVGFFAMDYDSPAGKRRTLATNFEPASERLFMPSWDEPGLKATFSMSVELPSDRMAIANMPAASTEACRMGGNESTLSRR